MNSDIESKILESLARTDEAQKNMAQRLTKIESAMEKQSSIMERQAESRVLIKAMDRRIADLEAQVYTFGKETVKVKTILAFMLGSGIVGAGVAEILRSIL